MATSRTFNLTAELNLRGPTNIGPIISNLKNQLSNISANVTVNVATNAATNIATLNNRLTALNATLVTTRTNSQAAAAAIQAFATAVNSVNVGNIPQQITAVNSAINTLGSNNAQAASQIKQTGTEMEEFGRQAGLAVRRFAAFTIVGLTVTKLSRSMDQGVKAFIEYDQQLVKLQQVTGQTATGLKGLTSEITELSTGLGVSSSELTEVASTLAQAGLSAKDTEKALKALALSSLAPSFDGMNETVEGSIALMRQFDISANDLEKSLGSINAVSAKFAVEASDIITAIQRTGGVFAAASKGVSSGTEALNEFVAIFTSVRATTRESAETIATGLRTIFSRIQRGDTIEALKEYGVNLTDLDGKFVGVYKGVELLAQGLSRIDPRDLRFSEIMEELGGFRQIGKVIPLIQQFAVAQEALRTAQQGQGSLAKDATTAQLSLANQIAKVREQFLSLFREIGGSNTFQTITRGALSLAGAMLRIADSMKEVLPVLGIMFAFRGASAISQFGSGFLSSVKGNQKRANGGYIQAYAGGGKVKAMLMPGEAVVAPDVAARVGKNRLDKLNHAEKYSVGGGVKFVPGSGSTDSFGPIDLDVGSYVLRKNAVNAMGKERVSGLAKYADGGPVKSLIGIKSSLKGLYDTNKVTDKAEDTYGKTQIASEVIRQKQRSSYIKDAQEIWAASNNKISNMPVDSSEKDRVTEGNKIIQNHPLVGKSNSGFIQNLGMKELLGYINKSGNLDNRRLNKIAGGLAEIDFANSFKGLKKLNNIQGVDFSDATGDNLYEVKTRKKPLSDNELIAKALIFHGMENQKKFKNKVSEEIQLKYILHKVEAAEPINNMAKGGPVFGSGDFKFPKRISNAYRKELEKKERDADWNRAVTEFPKEERFMVDVANVQESFQKPFDEKAFKKTFTSGILRQEIFHRMADFAKIIGLPKENLETVIPQFIDFKADAARGSFFSSSAKGTRENEGISLEPHGYSEQKRQDHYGYEAILKEKTKKLAKIRTTPTKEYDDGSFDFDNVAYKKEWEETDSIKSKIFDLSMLHADANSAAEVGLYESAKATGRGAISIDTSSRFKKPTNDLLYHELTHQLMNSLKTKNSDVLSVYNRRVESLFSGDNNDLVDAFDALPDTGNYKSADIIYGRSYKNDLLSKVIQSKGRGDPSISDYVIGHGPTMSLKSLAANRARDFAPLNPEMNKLLKMGNISDESLRKTEDSGKEEFITTLMQNLPHLNSGLQKALDFTLSEVLGTAGITRQQYAKGGMVQRRLGILDTDVIKDPANQKVVMSAMAAMGMTDKSKYKDALSQMAAQSRVAKNLGSYKVLAGVAGTGKSRLATSGGRETTVGTLRSTTRFPILAPEDLKKATDVIDITATASPDKIESYIKYADKALLLSTSTSEEQAVAKERRGIRDTTGQGLYGRKAGATRSAPLDSATMEAALAGPLGSKLKVLGLQNLKRKRGSELVSVEDAIMDLYFGSFSPMQKGHEARARMAKDEGPGRLPYVMVGPNESIRTTGSDDPHSARTLAFPQSFRTLIAREALSKDNIPVMPKADAGFGIPNIFELPKNDTGQRRFVRPKAGSLAHTQGKDVESSGRMYASAGFGLKNIEDRIGGFSGTLAREAILSGNTEAMQEMLSPTVFDVVNRNLIPLQNRANIAPKILANYGRRLDTALETINAELSQLPARITKEKMKDPVFFEQSRRILELRKRRDRLKSSGYAPHKTMQKLAKRYPEYYGLETGLAAKSLLGQMPEEDIDGWMNEFFPQAEAKSTVVTKAESSGLIAKYRGEAIPENIFSIDPTAWDKRKQINRTITADVVRSVNREGYSELMSPNKVRAFSMLRNWMISGLGESGGAEATQKNNDRIKSIEDIKKTKKLAIVGIDPLDFSKTEGPMNLGDENVTIFMRGMPGKYKDVISKLRAGYDNITSGAAEEMLGLQGGKRKTRNLSEAETMAAGKAGAEGGMLESLLGKLGARGGTVQNRAIDYPFGLGAAAVAFPGIGSNWPTEAKRTLSAKNIADAKEEFVRFFGEKNKESEAKKIKRMAFGGEVPIMAQKDEYVINSASAKQIGYHNLDKLNKYHSGGRVTGYARGGSINSFVAGEEPFTGGNLLASSADKAALEGIIKSLEALGIASSKSSELIRTGSQITTQAAQQAMRADIDRAKTAGASAQQIAAAESQLIRSRLESDSRARTKNTMQSVLETGLTAGSSGAPDMGGLLQQIESGAEAAFRQAMDDMETNLRTGPMPMQSEEMIQAQLTDVDTIARTREESYRNTTDTLTGSSLSTGQGNDMSTYIQESKQNRQLLGQMDTAFIAIKRRELASRGMAASEIEKTIALEIKARRDAAIAASIRQGSAGPGRTGIMGAVQNNISGAASYVGGYVGRVANNAVSYTNNTLAGKALGAVGSGVNGQAGYFMGMGVSMLGSQAETVLGKKDTNALTAGRVAQAESATGTIGAGLSLAGGVAGIPGIGLFAAGAIVVGTGLYALADTFGDFNNTAKNAANEFEAGIRAKNIAKATSDLEKSMELLQKDFNNPALREDVDKKSKARTELATKSFSKDITDASDKANPKGVFRTITGQEAAPLTEEKKNTIARDISSSDSSKQNENLARQSIELKIQQGMSLKDVGNSDMFLKLTEQILQTDEGFIRLKLSGDQVAISNRISARAVELLEDPALKAAEKAKQLSDAMDAADKAGRRLAFSLERMADTITQSIDATMFNFEKSLSVRSSTKDSLSGKASIQQVKSESINVLKNPKAYSEQEFSGALQEAVDLNSSIGGDPKVSSMITGSATLGRNISDKTQQAVRVAAGGKASLSLDEAKRAALKVGKEEIDSQPISDIAKEDLFKMLKGDIEKAGNAAKKDGQNNIDADAFDASLKQLGDTIGAKGKEIAISILEFKDNALNKFIVAMNEGTKNLIEADKYRARATEIGVKSGFDMRQVTSGVAPSFDELSAVRNAKIAQLTGGRTDPTDIANQKKDLIKKKGGLQNDLEQKEKQNDPDGVAQLATQIQQMDKSINQADEALKELANNADLATAALDEMKTIIELQKQTVESTKKVLSTGPKELKQQFDAMARVRFMMSGGTVTNTRQAQRAFTDTLRSTGNRSQAEIARQDVLARQRAEEQQVFDQMKPRAVLTMQNQNMTPEQIDKQMKKAEANMVLAQGRATGINTSYEADMIENPANANAAGIAAQQKFAAATGVQIQANTELSKEELMMADLSDATKQLTQAFIEAADRMSKAFKTDDQVENPLNMPAVAAPVAPRLARGGVVYASRGTLVNYEPRGTDTVPAMLTPGEFVVNATATSQNLPLLQAINREDGGPVPRAGISSTKSKKVSTDELSPAPTRAQSFYRREFEDSDNAKKYGTSREQERKLRRLQNKTLDISHASSYDYGLLETREMEKKIEAERAESAEKDRLLDEKSKQEPVFVPTEIDWKQRAREREATKQAGFERAELRTRSDESRFKTELAQEIKERGDNAILNKATSDQKVKEIIRVSYMTEAQKRRDSMPQKRDNIDRSQGTDITEFLQSFSGITVPQQTDAATSESTNPMSGTNNLQTPPAKPKDDSYINSEYFGARALGYTAGLGEMLGRTIRGGVGVAASVIATAGAPVITAIFDEGNMARERELNEQIIESRKRLGIENIDNLNNSPTATGAYMGVIAGKAVASANDVLFSIPNALTAGEIDKDSYMGNSFSTNFDTKLSKNLRKSGQTGLAMATDIGNTVGAIASHVASPGKTFKGIPLPAGVLGKVVSKIGGKGPAKYSPKTKLTGYGNQFIETRAATAVKNSGSTLSSEKFNAMVKKAKLIRDTDKRDEYISKYLEAINNGTLSPSIKDYRASGGIVSPSRYSGGGRVAYNMASGGIVSPSKYSGGGRVAYNMASGGIVSPSRYSGGGGVRASAAMINNGVSSNRSVNMSEQLDPIYKALGGLLENHAAAFGGQVGNLNGAADKFQQAFGMVSGGIAVNHNLTAQHNHSGHLNTLQQNIEDKTAGLVSNVIGTMRRSSDGGLDQMLGMDSNQIIGKSKYT